MTWNDNDMSDMSLGCILYKLKIFLMMAGRMRQFLLKQNVVVLSVEPHNVCAFNCASSSFISQFLD